MKQNIFGVILFSVIVGAAVFVSASLIKLPSPTAVEERPLYQSPVYESRSKCFTKSFPATPKIKLTQAVLNPRTNQLNTSFSAERPYSGNTHFAVTYHFFVKEGAETRFLASETVAIQPNFQESNRTIHEITSSYAWLDNLNTKSNLYLIASTDNDGFSKANSIPRFDEANATPVLLMKGKN